jgi:hypothetical protein
MQSNLLERITLDRDGNLYLDNKWVYVNRDDELDFYELKINTQNKINNMQIQDIPKNRKLEPLQVKMLDDEMSRIKNTYQDEESNYDFTDDEVVSFQTLMYNPEYKYIYEKENDDDYDEDREPEIRIFGNVNIINTNYNQSSYEVYIMGKYNNLEAYTEILYNNPLYRITVFEIGEFELNIIGTKNIRYKFEDEKLIRTNITYQQI